jgi:hypothetical protein
MTVNRDQVGRLLDAGLDFVAQYDNRGKQTAIWRRTDQVSALTESASPEAAARAIWGSSHGDASAREIAIEEATSILTILTPAPVGGFIVGAVEHWLFSQAAGELADRLEQAVRKQ